MGEEGDVESALLRLLYFANANFVGQHPESVPVRGIATRKEFDLLLLLRDFALGAAPAAPMAAYPAPGDLCIQILQLLCALLLLLR